MRYEYYTPLRVEDDLIVKFNIETGQIDPNTTTLHGSNKDNFQPRVSMTYAADKTVFRSGFGIFVGPGQGEDLIQPIESDPGNTTLSTGPFLGWNRQRAQRGADQRARDQAGHPLSRLRLGPLLHGSGGRPRCGHQHARRRRVAQRAAPRHGARCGPVHQGRWASVSQPAAFAAPLPGTFGNMERNSLHGPNFRQVDFFFAKHFRLCGRSDLEFRGEVFNMFNTTNFFNPGGTLNAAIPATPGQANTLQPGQAYTSGAAGPTFGRLTSTVGRTVSGRRASCSSRCAFRSDCAQRRGGS